MKFKKILGPVGGKVFFAYARILQVHFHTYRARYFIILAGCLEAAKLNRQPNGSYPNFNLTKRGVCHHCCVRFKSQVCCRGLGACCCGSVECPGGSGTGCMAAGACAPIKATPPPPTVHLRSTPPGLGTIPRNTPCGY
jgi:hypothetical protein